MYNCYSTNRIIGIPSILWGNLCCWDARGDEFCGGGTLSSFAPAPLYWRRNNCACVRLEFMLQSQHHGRGNYPGPKIHPSDLLGNEPHVCQTSDSFPKPSEKRDRACPTTYLDSIRGTNPECYTCMPIVFGSRATTSHCWGKDHWIQT